MIKEFQRYLVPILFVFLISSFAFAQENDRDAVIQRELDCITKVHESGKNYSWADLCYTDSSESVEQNPVDPNTTEQNVYETVADETVADENTALRISADADAPQFIKTKFEVLSGYRQDNLQFSIAGLSDGTSPNILSELTWDNIQSAQIQGKGEVVLADHFVFEGSAGYARVFSGDNQDSDYLSDNRVDEFSRSNNGADKGTMNDYSGGIGYRVNFEELFDSLPVEHWSFTPLAGYAYNAQNLRMNDGNQTYDPYNIYGLGPFSGLNNKYETEWDGPWFGAQMDVTIQKLTGSLRFEYHLMDYYAQADWNLRSDFKHPKSYEHEADADGYVITAGLGYQLSKNWLAKFSVDYYKYQTDHGVDRTFFSNGYVGETQLNVVDWDSFSFNVGLVCLF